METEDKVEIVVNVNESDTEEKDEKETTQEIENVDIELAEKKADLADIKSEAAEKKADEAIDTAERAEDTADLAEAKAEEIKFNLELAEEQIQWLKNELLQMQQTLVSILNPPSPSVAEVIMETAETTAETPEAEVSPSTKTEPQEKSAEESPAKPQRVKAILV